VKLLRKQRKGRLGIVVIMGLLLGAIMIYVTMSVWESVLPI